MTRLKAYMIGQIIFSLTILIGTGFLLYVGNQYYYFTSLAFLFSLLGFIWKYDGEVSPIDYKKQNSIYIILASKLVPTIWVSFSVSLLINFENMGCAYIGIILISLYIADTNVKFYKVER
ncbi:MAG: hypothetical protein RBT49_06435 [Bacteroidales bacterium]|jgi:hypothetical protein|nr:hypothetical protein [Bacteroidales bacterium]